MRLTAPPCRSTFLAPHDPHLCMFLGFVCGQACEISPNIQVVALCVSANLFVTAAPFFAQDRVCRTAVPLFCATCLTTATCLEACLHPLSMDSPLS